MKWSETIQFCEPPTTLSHLTGVPAQDWGSLLTDRERVAYERGNRDGEKSLSEQLVQQRTEMAELQRGILESLRQAVPKVIAESQDALISIALEAVQKIVGDLPITAGIVETVIRDALHRVENTAEVVVQLHPEDLALLRKNDSLLLHGDSELGPLRLVKSADVTRGGCLIQTKFGLIDACREVKFDQLKQTLLT